MEYELECGHCGSLFTLSAAEFKRSVKCPVCGGTLTVAVAVPVSPAPPPPPPAPPPPPPPPPEPEFEPIPLSPFPLPLPPVADAPETPEERASRLVPPWPTVRGGLDTARAAAVFAQVLYGIGLFFDLLVLPSRRGEDPVLRSLSIAGCSAVLPAVIHVVGRLMCGAAPLSHGGGLMRTSLWFLGAAVFALLFTVTTRGSPVVAALGGLFALVSFVLWLVFLVRLGDRLGDDELTTLARGYAAWLPFGMALAAAFLTAGHVGAVAGRPPLIWFGRAATGATVFVLLYWYAALLRTAVAAIDRRAPVAPRY